MDTNFNKTIELIMRILIILPFVIIPIIWSNLPEEMSFYMGLSNNLLFSKVLVLFIIPIINFLIYIFFYLLSKNKYINNGVSFFNRKYNYLRLVISSILFVYFIFIIIINY